MGDQHRGEEEDFLTQLQNQIAQTESKNIQLNTALAGSTYSQQNDNLIQYQLETSELLNNIEHFLRGDYKTIDKDGNEFWATQTDDTLILFNNYGVSSMMSIIGSYIDKNTILSTYDVERVYEILADLGDQLTNFIFCNYEKMGMNTEFKKTKYQLVVIGILHSIESAYRRALRGKTAENINTSQIFTQSDMMGRGMPMGMGGGGKKRFSLFNPSSWRG